MAWPLSLGTRFRRQLRAPKARPFGLRELTAQRGQARRLSCQECEEPPLVGSIFQSKPCLVAMKIKMEDKTANLRKNSGL